MATTKSADRPFVAHDPIRLSSDRRLAHRRVSRAQGLVMPYLWTLRAALYGAFAVPGLVGALVEYERGWRSECF